MDLTSRTTRHGGEMLARIRTSLGNELELLSEELTRRLTGRLEMGEVEQLTLVDDERIQFVQQRMRRLGQLVAGLAGVDHGSIWSDRAGFGSIVRVRDCLTDEVDTYELMTGEFVDPAEGHVSLSSPIGHALTGARVGDEVSVTTPVGERRFEVLSVLTLPARLGIRDGAGDRRRERRASGKLHPA